MQATPEINGTGQAVALTVQEFAFAPNTLTVKQGVAVTITLTNTGTTTTALPYWISASGRPLLLHRP